MAAGSWVDDAGGDAGALPGKRKGAPAPHAWLLPCLLFLALAGTATAVVHKVGDEAGWTIIGNVNYSAWAAANIFHVGDSLVFQYNKQFHNVLEVNRSDYRACNTQSPLATYATGNDVVTLRRAGHHFFLCGVPGHCAIGQKVDIRIPRRARPATAPSPASSPSPTSPPASGGSTGVTAPPAPSPNNSGAPRRLTVGWATLLVPVALAAAVELII